MKTSIPGLSDAHYQELSAGSGITDGQILSRGYRTINATESTAFGFSKSQHLPGLLIPITGVDGTTVNHRLKPSTPRTAKDGKPLKYEQPAKAPMRLDIPKAALEHLKNPNVPLWVTEGEKKVDSFTCRARPDQGIIIGVSGVWNWRGTNNLGGLTELADWEAIALNDRQVFLCFDGDVTQKEGVQKALKRLAAFLKRKGAKVHIVLIPEPTKGLDDYLVAGGSIDHLKTCLDNDLLLSKKPIIQLLNRSHDDILSDAVSALARANDPPELFTKQGQLVEVFEDEEGQCWIRPLNRHGIHVRLAKAADWLRDESHKDPPETVCNDILNWPTIIPGIPQIEGVSACPILSEQGTFTDRRGYDPHSHWYVTGGFDWVPFRGTHVDAAAWIMREVFGEFPFEDDASKANILALMLTPFVRPRIAGMVPMFYGDAPQPRTGKGTLLSVALIPAIGQEPTKCALPIKEEEVSKTLLTFVLQARQVVFFDNIKHKVNSPSLEACLTSGRFSGRVLGTNTAPDIPVRSIFAMTSNHGEISTDLAGRCVWVRINAAVPNPEERVFARPLITEWVLDHRKEIIGACIRIVEAWVTAGCPKGGYSKASYVRWSQTLSGILATCNVEGIGANDQLLKSANAIDDIEANAFVAVWWEKHIEEMVETKALRVMASENELLGSVFDTKHDPARVFGRFVASLSGRVFEIQDPLSKFAIVRVERAPMLHGSPRFRLIEMTPNPPREPTGGLGALSTTPTGEKGNGLFVCDNNYLGGVVNNPPNQPTGSTGGLGDETIHPSEVIE